jgi:hypothetical protein
VPPGSCASQGPAGDGDGDADVEDDGDCDREGDGNDEREGAKGEEEGAKTQVEFSIGGNGSTIIPIGQVVTHRP